MGACIHTYVNTYVPMCADDTCIHLQYAGIYLDPQHTYSLFFVMFVCRRLYVYLKVCKIALIRLRHIFLWQWLLCRAVFVFVVV